MLAVEEQSRTEQNRRTRDRANQACLTVSIAKDEASLMDATVLQLPYLRLTRCQLLFSTTASRLFFLSQVSEIAIQHARDLLVFVLGDQNCEAASFPLLTKTHGLDLDYSSRNTACSKARASPFPESNSSWISA